MKKVLKWFFIAVLVLVLLVVVFLLSLDTIIRVAVEKSIRAQTGMEAEIGKFHLGLLEPVVTIKDFKLHNPADFGGTPFLNIPEIHVEYDRDALVKNQIHLTLVRFNLGELDIVKNEAGKTNIFSLGVNVQAKGKETGQKEMARLKRETGLSFRGIDVLNFSFGTAKFIDLKDSRNNREQKIGLDNVPVRNIQSPYDLVGLVGAIQLYSGDFFTKTFGAGTNLW